LNHDFDGVIDIRCIDLYFSVVLGFKVSAEFFHASFLFAFNAACFSAEDVFVCHAFSSQLGQFSCTDTITTHEFGVDAKLLHLLEHRACNSVHATEENDVWLLALEGGQNSVEVRRLVSCELVSNQIATGCFNSFFKFFSHTLAIRCTVINHGNALALECFNSVFAQCAAQVNVISHNAESTGVTLACVFRIGG